VQFAIVMLYMESGSLISGSALLFPLFLLLWTRRVNGLFEVWDTALESENMKLMIIFLSVPAYWELQGFLI